VVVWPGGEGAQFPILPATSGQAKIASKDNTSKVEEGKVTKSGGDEAGFYIQHLHGLFDNLVKRNTGIGL
jgi:hypothetical protein